MLGHSREQGPGLAARHRQVPLRWQRAAAARVRRRAHWQAWAKTGGPPSHWQAKKQAGPAAAAAAWGAGDSDPEPEQQSNLLYPASQPRSGRSNLAHVKPRHGHSCPGRGASGLGLAFSCKLEGRLRNSVVISESWPLALIGDSDRGTSLGFVPRAWQGASGLRTCQWPPHRGGRGGFCRLVFFWEAYLSIKDPLTRLDPVHP